MSSEPALSARGLSVRRGTREVLHDIDLDVDPGEIVALVGPNGAGKSTLVRAFSGDEKPQAGRALVAGRDASAWRPRDAARVRAVLPQTNTVAFPFLVEDVVAMGLAPWRSAPDHDERVAAAIGAAEVTELLGRRVTGLSGGEGARVAFARFLAQGTSILLLDEPTAAMDPRYQERCFEVLRDRAHAGAAVVAVLHDLNLAAAYADRVAVLADGRLIGVGPPAEVLRDDLLSRAYGYPMEVEHHPRSDALVVLPRRRYLEKR